MDLNQDFQSNPKEHKHLESTATENSQKHLDMRPYMIERPFTVTQKDTLEKVHLYFRQMHVRQLLVVHNSTETLLGVITRQDLFQYMSL